MFRRNGFAPPLLFALALFATGCGPDNSEPKKKSDKGLNPDFMRLTSARELPDLLEQIRQNIKKQDDLILVEDPTSLGLSVMPANSPWVVYCGIGLKVIFGSSVSGSDNDIGNDVQLQLSFLAFTKDRCREIAPAIGRQVRAIQSGG